MRQACNYLLFTGQTPVLKMINIMQPIPVAIDLQRTVHRHFQFTLMESPA